MDQRIDRSVRTLAVTEALLRLKALFVMPILTKHFGAVNYGVWAQVTVIVTMIGPLLTFGLDSAVMRFLPGKDSQTVMRGFASVASLILVVTLPVIAALYLASDRIAVTFFSDPSAGRFVAICGPLLLVGLLVNQCRNVFRVTGSARAYSAMAVTQALTSSGAAVVVALTGGTIWDVIVYSLAADLILLSVALAVIVGRLGIQPPSLATLRPLLAFGIPLLPGGYAMWALNSSDRLFLGHYQSLAEIGIYSVAYTLGYTVMIVVFNPLWLMYQPEAAIAYADGNPVTVNRLFRWIISTSMALIIPAIAGLIVLGAPILTLVASPEFARGALVMPLITAAYALHMVASVYEVHLGLVNRPGLSIAGIIAGVTVNVGLNFIVIPRYGILGASATTLLGFAIQAGVSATLANRRIPTHADIVFLFKVLGSAAAMAIVLRPFVPASPTIWSLAALIVFGALVYLAAMVLLRAARPATLVRMMIGRSAPADG